MTSASQHEVRIGVPHEHRHRHNHAVAHSIEQRSKRDVADLEPELEEQDDNTQAPTPSDDEGGPDYSDVFREDASPEYDLQSPDQRLNIRDFILPSLPRAQWRVSLTGSVQIEVHTVGQNPDNAANRRRRKVLSIAARHQRRYLETTALADLKVLATRDVTEQIKHTCTDDEVREAYSRRDADVAGDIAGQYFYAPSGRLHAVSFLLQGDVCGVAISRVYDALSEMTLEERRTGQVLLDKDVASMLSSRFAGSTFTARIVARWRESEEDWSSMRLFFPNKESRAKLYGNL